jgi:hypothetical protein
MCVAECIAQIMMVVVVLLLLLPSLLVVTLGQAMVEALLLLLPGASDSALCREVRRGVSPGSICWLGKRGRV